MATAQFLVHSPKDNVGVVVVEDLKAGTDMLGVITETDTTIRVKARHDIPIGHKVALKDLKAGDTVRIQMVDAKRHTIFGAIEQTVAKA